MAQHFLAKPDWPSGVEDYFLSRPLFLLSGALRSARSQPQRAPP